MLLGVFFLFLKMKSSWEIVLRVTYLYLDKKHAEAGHVTLQVCCVLSCDNHVVYNLRPPFLLVPLVEGTVCLNEVSPSHARTEYVVLFDNTQFLTQKKLFTLVS